MKTTRPIKPILLVALLAAFTCGAMAYTKTDKHPEKQPVSSVTEGKGLVSMTGNLVQDKIFTGGDGRFSLSLILEAADVPSQFSGQQENVDLVVVLDRSGSMGGAKIRHAKQSVMKLLSELSAKDRFALVTYSDTVTVHTNLIRISDDNRHAVSSMVQGIRTGGATNLAEGLTKGIDLILSSRLKTRQGKILLISDGLANRGITDTQSIGNLASVASEKAFSISTVGVGTQFNEQLMTAVADRGTGRYYYLSDPGAFAAVFQKEFQNTKTVAANALAVHIPLTGGMALIDASGYPIEHKNGDAVFYPGVLRYGQKKHLFLTFRVPVDQPGDYLISGIKTEYLHQGEKESVHIKQPLQIACVNDAKAVFSSIKKEQWEQKVLSDDYNRLREQVALDIKAGDKKQAMKKIDSYYQSQKVFNTHIQSKKVSENLEKDVGNLKKIINDTFSGSQGNMNEKQKTNAKALQFEAYQKRRGLD